MNSYIISIVTQDVDAAGQWTGGDLSYERAASVDGTESEARQRAAEIAARTVRVVERYETPRANGTVGRDRFVRVERDGIEVDDIVCTGGR